MSPCLCLFFYVSDTMAILPVHCWLPGKFKTGHTHIATDTQHTCIFDLGETCTVTGHACIALINEQLNLPRGEVNTEEGFFLICTTN